MTESKLEWVAGRILLRALNRRERMGSLSRKVLATLWAAFLAFLILAIGQGIWGALLIGNIRSTPAIPWSVFAMAIMLWLLWQYLGGRWFSRSTSNARKLCLRANLVPGSVMAWALLAGLLAIVALAGYWIVLMQLVRTAPNHCLSSRNILR